MTKDSEHRVECTDCLHYGFSECQVGEVKHYPYNGHLCPRFSLDPVAEYEMSYVSDQEYHQ